jgi:hypothetical protein
MITLRDMDFHTPENVPYTWGETNYFDIHVPEANIHAWIQCCFRAGVGAAYVDVEIVDRKASSVYEALYVDRQNHLPLPERLDKFSLPNGLSVDATGGPRNYRVDYVGVRGTEIHVDVAGIMEPYDITDPAIDPLAAGDTASAASSSGFGAAYSNHFDMTCRVTGELTVDGRTHTVDCIAVMDHSWGPRDERGMRQMTWANANFSESFALHGIWSLDDLVEDGPRHEFKHGYAVVDGELRGGVGGTLNVERDGQFTRRANLSIVDAEGREYRAIGEAVNHLDWFSMGNAMVPMHAMRWHADGRPDGRGSLMDVMPLEMVLPGGPVSRRAALIADR